LNPRPHASGFSLLEIRITLLLLATGLLGLMRLSLISQQNRLDSLVIHRAALLSQNLLEQSLASSTLANTLPTTASAALGASGGLSYWVSTSGTPITEVLVRWHSPLTNASSTLCFAAAASSGTSYCANKSSF